MIFSQQYVLSNACEIVAISNPSAYFPHPNATLHIFKLCRIFEELPPLIHSHFATRRLFQKHHNVRIRRDLYIHHTHIVKSKTLNTLFSTSFCSSEIEVMGYDLQCFNIWLSVTSAAETHPTLVDDPLLHDANTPLSNFSTWTIRTENILSDEDAFVSQALQSHTHLRRGSENRSSTIAFRLPICYNTTPAAEQEYV